MRRILLLFIAGIIGTSATGEVRLPSGDIEVLKGLCRGFAEDVVGVSGAYSVRVEARTAVITDATLRKATSPLYKGTHDAYSELPPFQSMLSRASRSWTIPLGRYGRLLVQRLPRLPCLGGQEPANPYAVKLVVSAPGYSPDRREAMIYVRFEDCLSNGEEVCLLRRISGEWQLVETYVLWEQGE